jgi:hypothetical protein
MTRERLLITPGPSALDRKLVLRFVKNGQANDWTKIEASFADLQADEDAHDDDLELDCGRKPGLRSQVLAVPAEQHGRASLVEIDGVYR